MAEKKKWDYNPQGNKNDKVVCRLLQDELKSEYILHTIDVRDDKFFQRGVDVDLLIVNKDYRIKTVEIKADNYGAVNGCKRLFLETVANDRKFSESGGTDGLGCIVYSKSDYILYYFIKLQSYLIIPTKELQNWVKINMPKGVYEVKSSQTLGYNGEVLYRSYGMLVPINVLIDECNAKLYQSKSSWDDYEKMVA